MHSSVSSPALAFGGFIFAVLLCVGLCLLAVCSWLGIPIIEGSIAACAAACGLLGIAFLTMAWRGMITVRYSAAALCGLPLLVVGLLSAAQGGLDFSGEIWGRAFELGSVGSLFLFFLAIFLGSFLQAAVVRFLLILFAAGTTLVGGVQGVAILVGSTAVLPWTTLSFFSAAALVAVIGLSESTSSPWRPLYPFWVAGLFVLFLCFFHGVAAIGVFVSILILLLFYVIKPRAEARIPLIPLCVLLALCGIFFFGIREPLVGGAREIRPSPTLTQLVGTPVLSKDLSSLFLGSGPRTFPQVWERYRPAVFNETPFWNTTFESAYSTALTLFIELGMLGLYGLLLWPLALIYVVRKSARADIPFPAAYEGSLALSVFCLCAVAFYVPGLLLFLVGGLSLGWVVAMSAPDRVFHMFAGARGAIGIALLSTALAGTLGWVGVAQIRAAYLHSSGVHAQEGHNPVPSLVRAAEVWPTSLYARDASRAALENAYATLDPQQPDTTAAFAAGVDVAIEMIERAVVSDSKDWRTWLSRGSLYLSLVGGPAATTSVELFGEVQRSVAQARSLAPMRPEIPYLAALAYVRTNDNAKAQKEARTALELKKDYEPALELLKALQ